VSIHYYKEFYMTSEQHYHYLRNLDELQIAIWFDSYWDYVDCVKCIELDMKRERRGICLL